MKDYLKNPCPCGKNHTIAIDEVVVGKGVVARLPEFVKKYGQKPFVVADINTYAAAGERVCALLQGADIAYSSFIYKDTELEPDERAVGAAFMHYDPSCDVIVGVGSGVINDICKILSNITGHPYIIVGTAPSMDGYASATSSMSRDGVKVSLNSRCADVIIGDTDILKTAPLHMLKSGLGDMLAKFVSIAEWRIAHLLIGEYYCEEVAQLIRSAVKKCVDNAEGLLRREETALEAVFEGLVIGGVAMCSDVTSAVMRLRKICFAIFTICSAPTILLYALSEIGRSKVFLYLIVAELVTIFLVFLYETFVLFVSKKISVLHWILYLCTVELFPVSLIVLTAIREF